MPKLKAGKCQFRRENSKLPSYFSAGKFKIDIECSNQKLNFVSVCFWSVHKIINVAFAFSFQIKTKKQLRTNQQQRNWPYLKKTKKVWIMISLFSDPWLYLFCRSLCLFQFGIQGWWFERYPQFRLCCMQTWMSKIERLRFFHYQQSGLCAERCQCWNSEENWRDFWSYGFNMW